MSRLVSVVGDSNVRRNMTSLNMASRESIKNAQIIDCANISSLDSALASVRKESSLCIIACITNFIANVAPSYLRSTLFWPAFLRS